MLRDSILAGATAGMAATLIKNIPNLILWKTGIVEYIYFHLAASALISPNEVGSPIGLLVGVVVDIITGGTLGILIIYFLKITGKDYWWFKGLIVGNLIWLWGLGVAINFGVARIVPLDPVFRLTSLIEHQIFGLAGSFLIIQWYPGRLAGIPNKE
ncbi:MAG: hypothetical protein CVU89_11705 [Firmicutes bacterium HGW-Firmicutes-14]|nr:MAG: hypothetical protein CVU89_11705 [Firmicutes bacterium HGW-Firmicutes-14]